MSEDPFVTHRSLLFTVAYEMLGSAADAEDVVQETWVRWANVAQEEVRDPRAYLVRIVTRQALDRARTLARRREDYVGMWLPEPLLTSPDVADDVELAESVSIAMLTVLETLGAVERAVFVLRDVFDVPYAEIAPIVGRTENTAAQLAARARRRVRGKTADSATDLVRQRRLVDAFFAAARDGDFDALLAVLDNDVVLRVDATAAGAPTTIRGAQSVAANARAFQGLAANTQAFQGLASNARAFQAIAANPRAFQALAANPRALQGLASNAQAFQAQAAAARGISGINVQGLQAISQNSLAFSAMAANPRAFQALAANPRALQAISSNPQAFAAVASQPAFAALAGQPAFSAMASDSSFANAIGGNSR